MGISTNFENKRKRKNEVEIDGSNIKEIDVNIYEVCKSICKIYITY